MWYLFEQLFLFAYGLGLTFFVFIIFLAVSTLYGHRL